MSITYGQQQSSANPDNPAPPPQAAPPAPAPPVVGVPPHMAPHYVQPMMPMQPQQYVQPHMMPQPQYAPPPQHAVQATVPQQQAQQIQQQYVAPQPPPVQPNMVAGPTMAHAQLHAAPQTQAPLQVGNPSTMQSMMPPAQQMAPPPSMPLAVPPTNVHTVRNNPAQVAGDAPAPPRRKKRLLRPVGPTTGQAAPPPQAPQPAPVAAPAQAPQQAAAQGAPQSSPFSETSPVDPTIGHPQEPAPTIESVPPPTPTLQTVGTSPEPVVEAVLVNGPEVSGEAQPAAQDPGSYFHYGDVVGEQVNLMMPTPLGTKGPSVEHSRPVFGPNKGRQLYDKEGHALHDPYCRTAGGLDPSNMGTTSQPRYGGGAAEVGYRRERSVSGALPFGVSQYEAPAHTLPSNGGLGHIAQ